mmetsp:Transcript_39459/g.104596  ORF Transcript_39459/g.104596 Transcript_39459/m.104596 type:complete len:232 (-) Transcript_39459:1038-1733(-)
MQPRLRLVQDEHCQTLICNRLLIHQVFLFPVQTSILRLFTLFLQPRFKTILLFLECFFLTLCLLQTVREKPVLVSVRFQVVIVCVQVLQACVMSNNFICLLLLELGNHSINCFNDHGETVQPNTHGKGREDHVLVAHGHVQNRVRCCVHPTTQVGHHASRRRHLHETHCLTKQTPGIIFSEDFDRFTESSKLLRSGCLSRLELFLRTCTRLPKSSKDFLILLLGLFRLGQI